MRPLPLVSVRESARARRLTIKVSPDSLPEVVVPVGTRQREIERLLRRNHDWIARKLAELEQRAANAALGLDRPGIVWLHGDALPIEHRPAGRSVARLVDGRLAVGGPAAAAGTAIERWYRRTARRRLGDAVRVEAALLGVSAGPISVRDPRTRWGSCSPQGALAFSWRLLLAPREVLDYVVVHELCHLRELNHSPAFWRLLDEARPGWRSQVRWLRDHGWEIGRFRPRLSE
jgi:predicted metal-dependent hydrolase